MLSAQGPGLEILQPMAVVIVGGLDCLRAGQPLRHAGALPRSRAGR